MYDLIPAEIQSSVSKDLQGVVDRISSSGIYSALRTSDYYQNAKHEVAGLLASIVENKFNEDFHKKLGVLEKAGFLSKEKIANHQRDVSFGKLIITAGVPIGIDLVLIGIEKAKEKKEFELYANFIMASLAFVNDEITIPIRQRVEQIYKGQGYRFNEDKISFSFDKYAGQKVVKLPSLPRSFKGNYSNLFMTIANTVDVSDNSTALRLGELGCLLGLSMPRIEECLKIAGDSEDVNSDIVGFSSLSMFSIFSDMFTNLEYGKQVAPYSIELDYYNTIRNKRRNMIAEGASVAAAAAISTVVGHVGDAILIGALPVVMKFLSTDGNVSASTAIELNKRIRVAKDAAGANK